MIDTLDPKDSEILRVLQDGVAVTSKPFAVVADAVGITEDEVISRLKQLIENGKVRKFGAVIAPKKMGYVSTLAALDVPEDQIEKTAEIIGAYKGVTHNYLREGHPNIWFTMTEPDETTLQENIKIIEDAVGFEVIKMPVTRMFKIGVKVDV